MNEGPEEGGVGMMGRKKQGRDVSARAKDDDGQSITVDGRAGLRKRRNEAEGTWK